MLRFFSSDLKNHLSICSAEEHLLFGSITKSVCFSIESSTLQDFSAMSLPIRISNKKVCVFTLRDLSSMYIFSLLRFQHIHGGQRGEQIVRFILIIGCLFPM